MAVHQSHQDQGQKSRAAKTHHRELPVAAARDTVDGRGGGRDTANDRPDVGPGDGPTALADPAR